MTGYTHENFFTGVNILASKKMGTVPFLEEGIRCRQIL